MDASVEDTMAAISLKPSLENVVYNITPYQYACVSSISCHWPSMVNTAAIYNRYLTHRLPVSILNLLINHSVARGYGMLTIRLLSSSSIIHNCGRI